MATSIQIHQDFRYVGAAIISTVWLLAGQSMAVSKHRKRAGIKYPQPYAEQAQVENNKDAFLFNCAQRAHQNTLEILPVVWASTVIVGLHRPVLAACLCGLWTLSRISYTFGYLTGDPQKRNTHLYRVGSGGSVGLFLAASAYAVYWVWQGVSTKLGF